MSLKMSKIFLFGISLLLSAALGIEAAVEYKESITDMMIQCNAYQPLIFSENRTTHQCEKDNFSEQFSYIVEPMETHYSKKKFWCFLFIKEKLFKLKFKLWFSHRHYQVEAYGVKFRKPDGDKWESRIKFETTVFVVAPVNNHPLPQIFGMELNGVDRCPLCGRRLEEVGLKTRITDGEDTDAIRWPWHATIYHLKGHSFKYKCGGTLIQTKAVVTTAACLYDDNKKINELGLQVEFGVKELMQTNNFRTRVFRSIIHPGFSTDTLENNIGLLMLQGQIKFNADILPICLPNFEINVGVIVVAVGYGKSENGMTLQNVDIPVADEDSCFAADNEFYEKYRNDGNFCGGWDDKIKNVCGEDSGGGLYYQRNDIWYMSGITSVTKKSKSGSCNKYALFTTVSQYLSWIESESSSL